jgi:hypothetical protein
MLASWLPRVLPRLFLCSKPWCTCRNGLSGRSWLGRILFCCFPILHSVGRGRCRCMLAGCRRLGRTCSRCFCALQCMVAGGSRRSPPGCCWPWPRPGDSWHTCQRQLPGMTCGFWGVCRPALAGCACLGFPGAEPLHSLPSMRRCRRSCMLARNCNNRSLPLPFMTGSGSRCRLARGTLLDLPSMPVYGR